MTEARKIDHAGDLSDWLDFFFGGQDGYVYAPTKNETGYWQPHHFKWPETKQAIITHVLSETKDKDVYLSPSLFKSGSGKKADWKGTNFVWAEFDGNAPAVANLDKVPAPNIRVQSSERGHEHWYWKLEDFQTDKDVVESLSKKLTYSLEGDRSGWDANQVLRPPGTLHHDSRRRVKVLAATRGKHRFVEFRHLEEVPLDDIIEAQLGSIPDIQEVVAKFKWSDEALELFHRPTQKTGSRSSALTKLALHCVEMGMANEEAYSVLYNADSRWKKYVGRRNDFKKRLSGIISYARAKKGLQSELLLSNTEPAYLLGDFLTTEIKVEWLYKDLLQKQGLGILSSAPGFGKSQLSFRLGLHAAIRRQFLAWECESKEPSRVGILSFEMGHAEVRSFIDAMWPGFTPEEQEILRTSVVIMPLGYAMPLDQKKNQDTIIELVDHHELDFLVIDSLKATTSGLQEDKLDKFFEFVNRDLRSKRESTVWLIHHNRKPPAEGSRKPKDLSDLYGDIFIAAHATTVLSLWKRGSDTLEVMNFKTRLAKETDSFLVKRTNHFDWKPVEWFDEEPVADKPKGGKKSEPDDPARFGM